MWAHGKPSVRVLLLGLAISELCPSQTVLNTSRFHILGSDLAIFESEEKRTDLQCEVAAVSPQLDFDLRAHIGYNALIPMRDLIGPPQRLRIMARITPDSRPGESFFLVDRIQVPSIAEDTGGAAEVSGEFLAGPGHYHVDWLMRDGREHVCSTHWEFTVKPNEKGVLPGIAPETIAEAPKDPFAEQSPPKQLTAGQPLHIQFLVNFSTTNDSDSAMKPRDVAALVAMLRGVAQLPRVGRFSITAFNMSEEKVIYREDNVTKIDFPALGKAVRGIHTGTVGYRQLADPDSKTRFLASLLTEHVGLKGAGPRSSDPDAIILVGPKVMLDRKLDKEAIEENAQTRVPVFYLNYNPDPTGNPWKGAIDSVLKAYRGLAYTITAPRDFGSALADMTARLKPGTASAAIR
ncbi:MAG: hypothetical protein IANPNBLG_02856 [Bryobacteraceae bacterium]|nr:hypothetical protein [Bryobacteraceae bacterium]